jgi:hypothetical protein
MIDREAKYTNSPEPDRALDVLLKRLEGADGTLAIYITTLHDFTTRLTGTRPEPVDDKRSTLSGPSDGALLGQLRSVVTNIETRLADLNALINRIDQIG